MKITEKQIRKMIQEEIRKASSKKTSKRAIKESQRRIKLSSLLSEEDSKMDSKIENPETGRKIKIKTALGYKKSHPAYKAAKAATEKQGNEEPRGDSGSKSQGQIDVTSNPDIVAAFKQDDSESDERTKERISDAMVGAAIDKGTLPIKPGMKLSQTVDEIGQAVDGVVDGVSAQDFDKYKGDPEASTQLKYLAKKAAYGHMGNFTGSDPKNEKEILKDLISKSKGLVDPKHIAALSKATKQSIEGGAGQQAFDDVAQSKDVGSGGEKPSDTSNIQTKDPEKIAKKLDNSKKLEKVINRRKSDPESEEAHDEYNLMISALMQSAGMDPEEADNMPWNEYVPPTDSHQEIIDNLAGWMADVE